MSCPTQLLIAAMRRGLFRLKPEATRFRATLVASGFSRKIAVIAAAALVCVASTASAQDQPTEFESWHEAGWSFTPGVIFGGVYDSNVAVSFPRDASGKVASDKLFET